MKSKLLERLPKLEEIHAVYGIIVTLIYGWSIYRFIWKLPSWLKFLMPGEIATIGFYTLVNDLFESLLILVVFLGLALILPGKWLREKFTFRGGLSALSILSLFVAIAYNNFKLQQIKEYWAWAPVGFIALHILFGRVHLLRVGVEKLAEATTVFLYLTIPFSLISLLVVLVRNMLGAL